MIEFLLCVLYAALLYNVYFLFKTDNTFNKRMRIADAIFNYNIKHCIGNQADRINYGVIEPFNKTLYRWYDWSDRHIVPEEVYEKIKPYLKEVK